MRHRYECPVRWADLDLLGHVNNVVYVDYLQEARVDMLRRHARTSSSGERVEFADGHVVVRHEVGYRTPLTFRLAPVSIECWVTEIRRASFTMAYEVFDETDEGRVVYLRATTVLAAYKFADERPRRLSEEERSTLADFLEDADAESAAPASNARWGGSDVLTSDVYDLRVRFSDVDIFRHVNNVKYFEYYQEARIPLLRRLLRDVALAEGQRPPMTVVAQTDVDYLAPILFRERPYVVVSRIEAVGSRSFTTYSEIRDSLDEDAAVYSRARVVLVFFDDETQRAAEPDPRVREALLAEIAD